MQPAESKLAFEIIRRRFSYRLGINIVLAALAYVVVLEFIYPGYFAPLAAFHDDMYIPADLAANGSDFSTYLVWPRPVLWLTLLLFGETGFEGSVVLVTCVTILALALALTLLERRFTRLPLPWWLKLGSLMLAMAGPSFYFEAGYDLGTMLAMVFGLIGILVWESRGPALGATVLTLSCYVMSALAKESFLPALVVYGIARAFSSRPGLGRFVIVALPVIAAAIAFVDSQLSHSVFVAVNAAKDNPYRMSLSPSTILVTAGFYLSPLDNVAFFALAAACALGAWVNRTVALVATVIAAAFSLYVPYLLLPNHQLGYYQWAAMPLLMLAVPASWPPTSDAINVRPREATGWLASRPRAVYARAAIALSLAAAIIGFGRAEEHSPFATWSLQEQEYNRSVMAAIRSLAPVVRTSNSIVVCGLVNVFHPWHHASFVSHDLQYRGTWAVAVAPGDRPIATQGGARPVPYEKIDWHEYDLVVVFTADGKTARAYRARDVADAAARARRSHLSNVALASMLQMPSGARTLGLTNDANADTAQPTKTESSVVPPGLTYDHAEPTAVRSIDGLYPSLPADSGSCCWIGPDAVLPVRVAARSHAVMVRVYLPAYAPFQQRGQKVTISAHGAETVTRIVSPGLTDLRLPLESAAQHEFVLPLHLHSVISVVPAELGMSGDKRHLSLIVRSASAQP
jgi:hypothetical protein